MHESNVDWHYSLGILVLLQKYIPGCLIQGARSIYTTPSNLAKALCDNGGDKLD